jgi:hypothetical protein
MAVVAPSTDQEYYRDTRILVTNQRVVIGSTTFPLETITAVKRRQTLRDLRPALLMFVVASVLVWCLLEQDPLVLGVVAAIFLGLTLILASEAKPKHMVVLTQSGQHIKTLTSYDRDYITKVVAVVADALQQHAQGAQQQPKAALPLLGGTALHPETPLFRGAMSNADGA